MNRFVRFGIAVAVMLTLQACGSDDTTTTAPSIPPPLTDYFPAADTPGTLTKNGAVTWPFIVTGAGTVTAALTTLGPDSTVVIGLSLGTWNGSGCQTVIANDKATLNSLVLGSASSAGNLCVRVYDVGNVVDPVSYLLTVVHQ